MRLYFRVKACITIAILLTVYFICLQSSLHLRTRIEEAITRSSHRLVVFGDDWSDTGAYRVAPPPKCTVRDTDPDQGALWTETLCEELACDKIDNFARSIPSDMEFATVGSLVDSDVFTTNERDKTLTLFDFKTQVQQFINYDQRKPIFPIFVLRREWTIFTVFFGIWDLLEYTSMEKADALHAIDRSIESLLHTLDILAEHVGIPIKVVIPKVVDVTFLPRFQLRRNYSSGDFAHDQHQSVFLWTYWNTVLSQKAAEWGRGHLYMPDLNGIVMNEIKANQFYTRHISDAAGTGKQTPLFDEVETPCLSVMPNAAVEKCFDPARYLFWDDVRLSGSVNVLIGREAARLVRENTTVNIDARERAMQGTVMCQKTDAKSTSGFILKLPPEF